MAVREGLLVLLGEGPRHGYDLRNEFEARTGALWRLNSGQVYTTLERLERDGLAESSPDGDDASGRRRNYRLTAAGAEELRRWLGAHARDGELPRDDLVMKILLAASGDPRLAGEVISAHRHQLLERLQEVRREQRRVAGGMAARLVADVQIVRLEADLRWLDLCEQRLRDANRGGTDRPGRRES
ncbi:MAG: helix-turn-helix transcriptional regulator [Actinobacteria bacterium]|nr:helix-turn-helix transcriptional regulator [Actinomycetota bacterium]